ncbi:MAG: hypothetical protein R3232_03230, partial [Clostridia bacterium]|nr:hypothetical protein [Clostridia bacterium]
MKKGFKAIGCSLISIVLVFCCSEVIRIHMIHVDLAGAVQVFPHGLLRPVHILFANGIQQGP